MEKIEKLTKLVMNELEEMVKNGGEGSGDFDHAGNPPHVGGSEPVESREKRGFKSKSERKEVKKEEKKYKSIAEGIKKDFEGKEIPQKIKEDFKKTYGVDLTEEENKDKSESLEEEFSKETLDWIKTQPMEKIPSIIETYRKMKEASKVGEETQRERRKKELEKIKAEKDKKNKEMLDKFKKSEDKRKTDAKKLTFEEYFSKHYSQYKLSKRSPVYDLAKGEYEEYSLKTQNKANNSLYKHKYIEY